MMNAWRRGFTVRDLSVVLVCLVLGMSLLLSLTGASRSLSQTQVCADNLRQLFTGLTLYVNQYNSYPPHNPWPTYMGLKVVNGISLYGFDPNIGFVMTHGLGLQPPATDPYASGHFIWFGADFGSLPDVCKCPALPPSLMDSANPEIEVNAMESFAAQYALSYKTSGTMRSATRLTGKISLFSMPEGGRNPAIPNPYYPKLADNSQGYIYVSVAQHTGAPSDNSAASQEVICLIQAVRPAEVQQPSRVYYLADSNDYRPAPGSWPRAGQNSGWGAGWGNRLFLGTRHFEYANVLYLDGGVSRSNQTHVPQWNMEYDASGNGQSIHWRSSTFVTSVRPANIGTQVHIMPVLMVKGWEYFFEASGVGAR